MQWRMIKRKFEDDSIKYPVDVQKSTMKAKVDEAKNMKIQLIIARTFLSSPSMILLS